MIKWSPTAAKPGAGAHKVAQNKIDKYAKLAASAQQCYLLSVCCPDGRYMTWHGHRADI